MSKLELIRAFADAGYVLIPLCHPTQAHTHYVDGKPQPCKTPGKVPLHRDWRDTEPGKWPAETLALGNYGVVLKAGDVVVDIDPRNFGWILGGKIVPAGTEGAIRDNPTKRLLEDLGAPLKSFTVKTGSGGYHIYLRKAPDVAVRNGIPEYPGVEFKSVGQQVVGPGSLHQSGNTYAVTVGTPANVTPAPQKLLDLIKRAVIAFDKVGTADYVNDAATQGRFSDYLEKQAPTNGSYKVACYGRDLGLPPATVWELMVSVWNPRRAAPRSPEELKVRVEHAYTYAKGAVGSKSPQAAFDAIPEEAKTSAGDDLAPSAAGLKWDTTPQGQMKKSFNNLMNYLRAAEYGLSKIIAYNEFSGKEEFIAPAPWHRGRLPRLRAVQDRDLALLKGHLAARLGYDASIEDIVRAITNVAYHERFHPVRTYLRGLKWDGKPRLETWLKDYLGVEDTPYTRACARKVLCAAVERVFNPGVKFDHVLVLEGAQDVGKSTAIEILAAPWHCDSPIDPHNRDTIDLLQGRWIVELAEMEVTRRVEEEALKAFITRKVDMARLAFGRTTGEFPRQSIFIATKNPRTDGTYLKDETGNRRWWPVRCDPTHGLGQVDFQGLKDARDQLFAEAVVKAREEKLYMETPELKAAAKTEAGKRHAEHEWVEAVALWIERCDAKPETKRDFMTARDVFIHALDGTDARFDRRSATSIAGVMRTLNWTIGYKRVGGHFCRGYLRPGTTAREAQVIADAAAVVDESWKELV